MASYKNFLPQPPPSTVDLFGNTAFCVSFRQVVSVYTGSCVRVRRSSDNAQQDINFVNGYVDTTELLSFCGAGSGYIHTWYDQSGNGRNVTQTATAMQPLVVNSGALYEISGSLAAFFDGTDDYLLCTTANVKIVSRSVFFVFKMRTQQDNGRIFCVWTGSGSDYNQDSSFSVAQGNSGRAEEMQCAGATSATYLLTFGSRTTITGHSLISEQSDGHVGQIYKNGALMATETSWTSFRQSGDNRIYLGVGASVGSLFAHATIDLQEVVYFEEDNFDNRELIQQQIMDYYQLI